LICLFGARVIRAITELKSKISKMEEGQLELQSRLDQQSQAYVSLTDKMHAMAQENESKTLEIEQRDQAYASLAEKMHGAARDHEQKTKEMDEAAQAALEETLAEIECLNQQLSEAQAELLQKGGSIASIKVTASLFPSDMQLSLCQALQSSSNADTAGSAQ
jgi:chromosome segregation ATPase